VAPVAGDGGIGAADRRMQVLAVVAIAVVVTAAFQTHPGPGLSGRYLAVTVAMVVFAVGTIAVVRAPRADPWLLLPLMAAVVVGAAALVGLQPNGAGFLGVFPGVAAAALRLPTRLAAAVAALAGGALAVAWGVGAGHHPVLGIVLNEIGVAAFFLLALFARRYQEANARAQELIAELNETRAAQAQAAALAERQRLAREMHDVLAHSLSGLVLNLEGARLLAARDPADPGVADAIGRAQRLAKTGLEEARRAIGMLRGDALPGPERLTELAAAFQDDTGIACACAIEGDERELGPDGRLTLYRVAQEALTNIRKHADPQRVELRLAYGESGTELTVDDHGRSGDGSGGAAGGSSGGSGGVAGGSSGGSGGAAGGFGYGLTGMRERAELLGGTLTAGPTADGFRVALWIPS
jgi:signal transduction histidine kinase